MFIRALGYDQLIGLESELKNLTDTSFKFYELGDLHQSLNSQPIHPITQKIKESGLVEVARFSMVVQAPKLVSEFIERYNLETKKILLPNQSILLSINKALMQSTFGVLVKEEYHEIDFSSSTSMFIEKKILRREDM